MCNLLTWENDGGACIVSENVAGLRGIWETFNDEHLWPLNVHYHHNKVNLSVLLPSLSYFSFSLTFSHVQPSRFSLTAIHSREAPTSYHSTLCLVLKHSLILCSVFQNARTSKYLASSPHLTWQTRNRSTKEGPLTCYRYQVVTIQDSECLTPDVSDSFVRVYVVNNAPRNEFY